MMEVPEVIKDALESFKAKFEGQTLPLKSFYQMRREYCNIVGWLVQGNYRIDEDHIALYNRLKHNKGV